jgi:SAM-dependent methyltransferase
MSYTRSARYYDAIYSIKDYAGESARLHELIRERRDVPGMTLLDVACGTGMHLSFLREHYVVVGLDVNAAQLEVARRRLPGITLYQADMETFDLGQRFDVVTCLFSAIGYVCTVPRLRRAVANMAKHVVPGGLLIIEPWLKPEVFRPGMPHARFVDEPELKLARIVISRLEGDAAIMDFHFLVSTPDGIESFVEQHTTGLFSHDDHLTAFRLAGMSVEHDPQGLTGRGLYVATTPADAQ